MCLSATRLSSASAFATRSWNISFRMISANSASSNSILTDLESRKLRPAYVFVGDEAFFRKRFRDAILEHLVPHDLREFSIFEFDLDRPRIPETPPRLCVCRRRGFLPQALSRRDPGTSRSA